MKLRFLSITFLFVLAACSSPGEFQYSEIAGNEEGLSQTNPEPIIPEDSIPAATSDQEENTTSSLTAAAFAGQFQSFFLDPGKVKVIESREVEWSDSCLGIDQPGVECVPQVTQGYEITLEANGLQFDYHADQNGGQVQPATLGLIWTRQGGEEKQCDRLIIYLPDIAHTFWCNSGEMHTSTFILQEILSKEEYEQFMDLLRYFNKNSIDQSAELGSEPLTISLIFHGQGSTSPEISDQQILLTMAENIFSRISH
jgi:hypothetical protein